MKEAIGGKQIKLMNSNKYKKSNFLPYENIMNKTKITYMYLYKSGNKITESFSLSKILNNENTSWPWKMIGVIIGTEPSDNANREFLDSIFSVSSLAK